MSGMIIGNILFGGPIGLIIDLFGDGETHKADVSVTLVAVDAPVEVQVIEPTVTEPFAGLSGSDE